jgi:hypothetical protein
VKEHHWHILFLFRSQVSSGGVQINLGHCIQLQATDVLSTKSRHKDHIIREVIQIELHPNSMNMEDDVSLRKSWEPLIHP